MLSTPGQAFLSPGSLKPANATLGERCRDYEGRAGGTRSERSLPTTLVHTADVFRPAGWLRWGSRSSFSSVSSPASSLSLALSLSLTPTPSPLLQDDVSTARQGLMGPLAN